MKSLKYTIVIIFIFSTGGCSSFFDTEIKDINTNIQEQNKLNQNNPFTADFIEPRLREFSDKAFLENIGLNIISKSTDQYLFNLQKLRSKLHKKCYQKSNLSINEDWQDLIYSFHKMDSQSFGPITLKTPQNIDYRNLIYSWPYSNHCMVDRQIYYKRFDKTNILNLPYNSKSLDTIEYLLYSSVNESKCSLKAHPYLKQWFELPDQDKKSDRCIMALDLINTQETYAQELSNYWNRNRTNYTKVLSDQKNQYKSIINDYSNALFSIESIKDIRLGGPIGKNKKICDTDRCPELVEHSYSKMSMIAIQARLEGFIEGFYGGDINDLTHHGFDDYLNQSQFYTISAKMKDYTTRASQSFVELNNRDLVTLIENLDIEKCKITTVSNRIEPLCAFHEDIRAITSLLKTEVLIALSLKAPPVYQGDND